MPALAKVLSTAPTLIAANDNCYLQLIVNRPHLTSLQAPNGAVTTMDYDGFGDVVKRVSPDTGNGYYSYDAAGNKRQPHQRNSRRSRFHPSPNPPASSGFCASTT